MLQGFSLSGLEDVAAGEDSPRRDAILSALTDQYLELEPRLSDRHIELYDNVFRVLVSGIELQARLALSEKLAAVKRAPREIIRDLANDEYAIVATPVLQQSPLLDEIDLVSVARNRSEAHRAALAQRPNLHTVVTDVLVDRREQSVLVALIGNDSARLSPDGAGTLADVANTNMVVAQALAARLELPAQAVTQILSAARAVVVNTLAHAEPDARAGDITEAVGEAVERVGSLPPEDSDHLTEQQIVTLYSMKSLEQVAIGLGHHAALDPDLTRRALLSPSVDGLLIVLKAADFAREHVEAMLSIKLGQSLSSQAVQTQMAQFDRVNPVDPARMLGFVLSRHSPSLIH